MPKDYQPHLLTDLTKLDVLIQEQHLLLILARQSLRLLKGTEAQQARLRFEIFHAVEFEFVAKRNALRQEFLVGNTGELNKPVRLPNAFIH